MTQNDSRHQPTQHSLAGRLQRLFAACIDLVALAVVSIFLILLSGILEEPEAYETATQFFSRLVPVMLVSYLLLHGIWLFKYGQSLGKRMLKIRINGLDSDQPPGRLKLLLRSFGLPLLCLIPFALELPPVFLPVFISFLLIDILFIFSRSRRCLHDYIAASEVCTAIA